MLLVAVEHYMKMVGSMNLSLWWRGGQGSVVIGIRVPVVMGMAIVMDFLIKNFDSRVLREKRAQVKRSCRGTAVIPRRRKFGRCTTCTITSLIRSAYYSVHGARRCLRLSHKVSHGRQLPGGRSSRTAHFLSSRVCHDDDPPCPQPRSTQLVVLSLSSRRHPRPDATRLP